MKKRENPSLGARKAAILLLSLDEETAAEILRDLDEASIQAIGDQVLKMPYGAGSEEIRAVKDEVSQYVEKTRTHYHIGDNARKLSAILGESAEEIRSALEPIEFLRRFDPKAIAQVLRDEHPQTAAVVLASMQAKKAREILETLPQAQQFEVTVRLANVSKVNKEFLSDLEKTIAEQLQRKEAGSEAEVGGVQAVAAIFNKLGRELGAKIMGEIEERDEVLAGKIKKLMFTFEDLGRLDDRSMQAVLKEATSEELMLALRQTSEEMKQKIFSNMSERAAAMLKEDLETHGPARLSDVEAAQSKIALMAKRLADEGKIVLATTEEKFM